MIECNMGKLKASGSDVVIMAEATLILDKVSEIVAQELGMSQKEVMKQIYKVAKKGTKND